MGPCLADRGLWLSSREKSGGQRAIGEIDFGFYLLCEWNEFG